MHSKFSARVVSCLLFCLLAISLSACSVSGPDNIENAKEPVAVSRAFETEGIWFYGADPAKDGNISVTLVFDGEGNVTRFDTRGLVYGDLKGLSDDEVLNRVRELDKENFEKDMQNRFNQIDRAMETWSDGSSDQAIPYLQQRREETEALTYEEPKAMPYRLHIWTDDTGNTTESESISYEAVRFFNAETNYSCGDIYPLERRNHEYSHTLENPMGQSTLTVYEKTYAGFAEAGLWTRVGDDFVAFTVDNPNTEGIEID